MNKILCESQMMLCKFRRHQVGLIFLICLILNTSCQKETIDSLSHSSVKIITTKNEPKQAKIVCSSYGNLLLLVTSGDLQTPLKHQELYLLNSSGEVLKNVFLSDTIFQYMNAVPGLNGGFLVSASSNEYPYIFLSQVDDNGTISWSKSIPTPGGTNKNEPAIIIYDNNYLVMYQSLGSGYYIWKGDAGGNEIFNRRIPIPNTVHYGNGLIYGEKFVRFMHANDTMIVIQGINHDLYSQMIDNCFIRAVDQNIARKWYSENYDTSHIESSSGLFLSAFDKILLFGSKTTNSIFEGYGTAFARTYSLNGVYENDILYPLVDGTPNFIRHSIQSPDGGFLMIGSNNQYSINGIVSPNKIILIKLNADLSRAWSKSISTSFPAKGYDVVYLKDGTIGLTGLLKDNFTQNKLLYLHLDAFGSVIKN